MKRSLTLAVLMLTLAACGGGLESTATSPESPETSAEAICLGDPWVCACAVYTTREECNASKRCYWSGPAAAGATESLSYSYCKPTYEAATVQAESNTPGGGTGGICTGDPKQCNCSGFKTKETCNAATLYNCGWVIDSCHYMYVR